MAAVLDAARQGVDLEKGPFPAKVVPLAAALAAIEQIKEAV